MVVVVVVRALLAAAYCVWRSGGGLNVGVHDMARRGSEIGGGRKVNKRAKLRQCVVACVGDDDGARALVLE